MASSAAAASSIHPNIEVFQSCNRITMPSWSGPFTISLDRQAVEEATEKKVSLLFEGIGGPDELDKRELSLKLTLQPPDYTKGIGEFVVKNIHEEGPNKIQQGDLSIKYNENTKTFNLTPTHLHRPEQWLLDSKRV